MQINNGIYEIGGIPVLDLANEYDVPLYVYDFEAMETKYKLLIESFSGSKIKVLYACKSLTNINVLKFFKQLGSGLDTVSIQEVWTGLKAGFAPQDIMYTPNCVSFEEIKMAVDAGVPHKY